jgi:glyoxylase-like metal-dependent hydrolase (beta-lactamase superfamily II)
MNIPLEDLVGDVIGKARRGLRLSESQLVQAAGVTEEQLDALQNGGAVDQSALKRVAGALALNPAALLAMAHGAWHPGEVAKPAGFAAFNTPFRDMTVNFYLAWDHEGGHAAAFDAGTDCDPMLAALKAHRLTLDAIFLTHTHTDHVAELDRLVEKTGAPVYVSALEPLAGAEPIQEGREFQVGGLRIATRLTPGHSPGGMTYVVTGCEPGLAVVGDALFASSMGGAGPEVYAAALRANRAQILSLPGSTVICPGHGPLTTPALELEHNPFYSNSL